VNQKGYLVNSKGDILDQRGNKVFDKFLITPEGEIPKVF
jgi:hypothetical protein